jgi:TolB protein
MQKLLYVLISVTVSSVLAFCGGNNASAVEGAAKSREADSLVKPTGMIAYVHSENEIRLINRDGSGDHRIWTDPEIVSPLGIQDLAWRPDGKELAFSSGHEAVASFYHADIYSIRPDGTGLQKVTNAPGYKELGKYKKGTITVTLQNNHYSFNSGNANAGVFTVYVVGAEMPQQVILPPGSSKTVVFKNVADFGDVAQGIIAMYGANRWFMGLDVVAGRNTKAPDFSISGDGIPYFGAYRPVWKSDGSTISFRDGFCNLKKSPSKPTIGLPDESLFADPQPAGACVWDWAPGPELSKQVIYSYDEDEDGSGFYIMNEGGVHKPSNRIMLYTKAPSRRANDVKWLPDGSGFLYSYFTNYVDIYNNGSGKIGSNIFKYDLRTKETTQVTHTTQGFANRFDISPDGQWIVYEKGQLAAGEDLENLFELPDFSETDLWVIKIDGSEDRLLIKNGSAPSWSR